VTGGRAGLGGQLPSDSSGGCVRSASTSISTLASSSVRHSGAGICRMASGVRAWAIQALISSCWMGVSSLRLNISSNVCTPVLRGWLGQAGSALGAS